MTKNAYHRLLYATGGILVLGAVFVLGAFARTHPAFAHKLFPHRAIAAESGPQADLAEFWEVWKLMEKEYPFSKDAPSVQDRVYGAISGLVSSYGDPYTTFFPPKEAKLFNDEVEGSFGGVGMEVGMRDGSITVIAPLKDSQAEHAGIKAGDIITAIDGKKTDGMDVDTAISLIRGDVDTTVTLTVLRSGEKELLTIPIVRKIVNLPIIETEQVGDAFVISLYSFTRDSVSKFRDALQQFNESKSSKFIIDLRDNPGGYLDAAVGIASFFLPQGETVVRENSGGGQPEIVHQSKGYGKITGNVKIAILVNGGSASASEILAGALSEHGIAKLVGTTTFGKGSVQEVIDLADKSSVKITVAKWFTPKGNSISEKGITPQIIVKEEPHKDSKTGKIVDPQLEAAIKALK